ncbi:MAG: DoxX family protein [Alphaproteobacteria bacterium]|nr:DoxX family protein [Alphaproteobacteria bacterium]
MYLFAEEYKVPLLPPEFAAVLGTFNELVMPILLFVGLAARLAALPLIGMTLVIQFVLGAADPAFDKAEHFYWLILLATVVIRGPGILSIDHKIRKRWSIS